MQLEFQLKMASDYESRGKYLHAAQIYHAIILNGEESSMPYVRLAGIYEKLANPEAGIRLLSEYLEDKPDQVEARLYLAQMLIKAERMEEAVEILSIISPQERPIASFISGYAYFNMKEYELAKINFVNFIKLSKNADLLFEAHLYMAKIYTELSEYEKALENAAASEKLFGVNWELHYIYSVIYYYKKMYSHASAHIEKAIRLNKENPVLYEWAGKTYLKTGDYVKAETYFLHYISVSQATAETYSNLGLACLNNKKPKDAINYFEIALALDPNNEAALDGKNKALHKV
jgi:tetratricopeptide (TPR) repeat protein